MKRTIGILANIALGVSVLIFLAVLLVPSVFGLSIEPVLGGSMQPTIKTGAMIVLQEARQEEIEVGDIIGFSIEGIDNPIVHRVIEIVDTDEGIGFRTEGDANEEPDSWVVKEENLIGKVVINIAWFGYVAAFIQKPYGFGLMIGLPAIAIIYSEIRHMFYSESRRRKPFKSRQKPGHFPTYLALIIGLVLIGVLWGLMVGNTDERTLGSFAQRDEEVSEPLYVSQRNMENKGILPLVICLFSEDETVGFSENYFWLSPGSQNEIEITGNNEHSVIETGGFFPLLPQVALYKLFQWNSTFAPLIVAAVWIIPLTIGAIIITKRFSYQAKPVNRARYLKSMRGNA